MPELLWQLTYGPTGHTLGIDRDLPNILEIGKGTRERMLCDACERRSPRSTRESTGLS